MSSKDVRRLLFAGFLSFLVYPLSFAPVDRLLSGRFIKPGSVHRLRVYHPVTRLIDHTSLKGPLLQWSGLWGMGERHRNDTAVRMNPWPGYVFDVF